MKSYCIISFIYKVLIFLSYLNNFIVNIVGIELKENGEYSINVAIDENIPEPSSPDKFKNDFKAVMRAFSDQMKVTTKNTFYVSLVNLLVPNHWIRFETRRVAVDFQYKNADIRISDKIKWPIVNNPQECGLSGNYMELPLQYFTKIQSSQFGYSYGHIPKLMLTNWARLRWGVWEEHGFSHDIRHPCFFKMPRVQDNWEYNGCSDVEIRGQYLNGSDSVCDMTSNKEPASDCSFHPFLNNTATTSLMSFHSLNTVKDFCDEINHNKYSPNRQNLFCKGSSVWKIIRQTNDFKKVNETSRKYPLWISITKRSDKPLFYMLLDNRQSLIPETHIAVLKKSLAKVWGQISQENVCGFGSFPTNDDTTNSGKYINEEVYWRTIGMFGAVFKLQIKNMSMNEKSDLNFALALEQKIEELVELDHLNGAILLIIKTALDTNNFGSTAYEQKILTSLITTKNIRIFSVEFEQSNLIQISEVSKGFHISLSINDSANTIVSKMLQLNEHLIQTLTTNVSVPKNLTSFKIHETFIEPNEIFTLEVGNYGMAEFYVTTVANSSSWHGFNFTPSNKTVAVRKTIVDEWNTTTGRTTIGLKVSWSFGELSQLNLSYTCKEEISICKGLLIVRTHIVNVDYKNIEIDVSTNAINNYVDLSNVEMTIGYFRILVMIKIDGNPVKNLTVSAKIRHNNWVEDTIGLSDNGDGHPDISMNDGIYSGYYVPNFNGLHKISVTVENNKMKIGQHEKPLIMHEDKNSKSDGFGSVEIIEPFIKIVDLASPVIFRNLEKFVVGKPLRILDLKVKALGKTSVLVTFTSPGVLSRNRSISVDFYRIYHSQFSDELLNYKSGGNITLFKINPTGFLETFQIKTDLIFFLNLTLPGLHYFIVQSFTIVKESNKLLSSELSNVGFAWLEPYNETDNETTNVESVEPFLTWGIMIIASILLFMIAGTILIYIVLKIRSKSVQINVPI